MIRLRHRRFVRIGVLAVVVLVLVSATVYRRQIIAYSTHWKGSPTSTVAYADLATAERPALRLAVAGDSGDSGSRLTATAASIATVDRRSPYDALLLLGDNVYPNGDPAKLQQAVFEPFSAVLRRGVPLLAIVGNHDVRDGNGPRQMAALGMEAMWWSRNLGDVLLIGLNSNEPDDPAQRAWLEATLAQSTARWRIVALHHPPYSAGYQGSSKDARAAFAPIFERYGVQLVLSGHDHDYQRSKPINGVTYVVSGGASGTRRTGAASFTEVSFSWHHFFELSVFSDRLVGRAVNQDVRVADEFTMPINRGSP